MVSRYQIATAPAPDGGCIVEVQRRAWEAEAARADEQQRWEVARSYALPGRFVGEREAPPEPVLFLRVSTTPHFLIEPCEAPEGVPSNRSPVHLDQLHHLLRQALIEGASDARPGAGRTGRGPVGPARCHSFALGLGEPLALHHDWDRHHEAFERSLAARGWRYGDIAELAELCGRARPSTLSRSEQREFLRWLEGDTRSVDAWLARRAARLDRVVAGALCRVSLRAREGGDADVEAPPSLVIESHLPWLDGRDASSLARLLSDPALASRVGPVTLLAEVPEAPEPSRSEPFCEELLGVLATRMLVGARQGVTRRSFRGPIKALQAYLNLALHPVRGNLEGDLSVWLGKGRGGGRLHLGRAANQACAALGLDPLRSAEICHDLLTEVVASWAHPWTRGRLRAHYACSLRLRLYNELERLPRKTKLRVFGRLIQYGFAERYLELQAAHGPWAIPPTTACLLRQLRRVAQAHIDAVFAPSQGWSGMPDSEKQAILDELQQRMEQRWSRLPPSTPRDAHKGVQYALNANAALDEWSERLVECCPERRPWDERLEALALFDEHDWEERCRGLLPGFLDDFLVAVRLSLHAALGHPCRPESWQERYSETGRVRMAAMADEVAADLLAMIGPEQVTQTTEFLVDSWLSADVLDESCSRGGHAYRVLGGVMDAHRERFWPSSVELYLARIAHGHSAAEAALECGVAGPDAFMQAANGWCLEDLLPACLLASPAAPLRAYTEVLHQESPSSLATRLLEGAAQDRLLAGVLVWDQPDTPSARAIVREPSEGCGEDDICWLFEGKIARHDMVVVLRRGHKYGPLQVDAIHRRGREIAQATRRAGKTFALRLFDPSGGSAVPLERGDALEIHRPSLEEHLGALFRGVSGFGCLSEGDRLELGRLLGRTRWKSVHARQVALLDGDGAVGPDGAGGFDDSEGGSVAVTTIIGRIGGLRDAQCDPRRDP